MRIARLLTVSRSAPGGLPAPPDAHPLDADPLPSHRPGQNDRRLWKYYLASNLVCGL